MKLRIRKTPAQPERRRAVGPTDRAPIFAYHTRRTPEPGMVGRQIFRDSINSEMASRAARYSLQRFGLLIVVAVALISLVNILVVSTNPAVTLLAANQNQFLYSATTYQKAAQKLFVSSLLNGNKITIDTSGISDALRRQFPELAVVSIKLPLIGHRPIVYLQATKSLFALTTSMGSMYAVDENGLIVGKVSANKSSVLHLVSMQYATSNSLRPGQRILSSDVLAYAQIILHQLQARHLTASKFVLPSGKSELDLYVQGQSYFAKFNLADPAPLQEVGTFLAVRQSLQEQGIAVAQYIDVRVPGRAYYL